MGAERHDPLLIKCRRGPAVESFGPVDAMLVVANAGLLEAWGHVRIALACALYNAQTVHKPALRSCLYRVGRGEGDLKCGRQLPYRKFSAEDCIGKGVGEERVFNISTGNYSTYLEMPLSNRRSKHTVVKH